MDAYDDCTAARVEPRDDGRGVRRGEPRDDRRDVRRDRHCDEVLVDCRLRAGTELFAHTWDPVVLAGLSAGPRRRSALLAMAGGISDKVLTDTLRRLLANGLVERTAYASAPPRVEYGLTPLGTTLVEGPMRALADWTLTHGDALLAAQEQATP